VVKRDGSKEPFKTDKIRAGIERACEKRPVDDAAIDDIVETVATDVKARGESTIKSRVVGDMVIEALKQLDEVAYIRYASVYNEFDDVASFEEEAKTLQASSD
jgi:transcriptional repressor NrdR